ncbi:MAG: hypothetical protein ACI35O_14790 [Bacillaceae bacterium]
MIEVKNLHKQYRKGESLVHAVRNVSLTVSDGEYIAIMGASWSHLII